MPENVKQTIISYLKTLPDDITIEDILYHLNVRKKIQQGLKDVENNNTISHEEMKNLVKTWNNLSFQK